MAEILIKAIDAPTWPDYSVSDPRKAESGCYRKGDIVEVREDGRVIGTYWEQSQEKPPLFVVVRVSGVTKDEIREWMECWERAINFSQISHDPVIDTFIWEVSAQRQSVCLFEDIKRKHIKKWIEDRGGKIVGSGETWVRIQLKIMDYVKTWRSQAIVTEISYNQGTGVHIFEADYSAVPLSPDQDEEKQVRHFLERQHEGVTVVWVHTQDKVARFGVLSVGCREELREKAKEALEITIKRRKYRVADADVDYILNNSPGYIDITKQQAINKVISKWDTIDGY